ncbi:hypothetical protein [Hyphomicrobium sp.]|uniref:hypothetical protein n=1 Tax=Hyphomicrobium sp. TaxID=82 RepID=UPI002E374ADF|nr:hypothetical protein [Hyphomicrobium sp.]HEX2842170.1 hypothetical protein [Hyphomicrobium sp.]
MNASPELAAAERELATARKQFNTARRALEATLSQHGAREGAADRLIHHADEYGVDHTLAVLSKTPEVLDIKDVLPAASVAALRTPLQAAYEAMHRVDLAMAKVENFARKGDPSRAKAVLIADKSYVFNAKQDTLRNIDSGETVKAGSRVVDGESSGPGKKREPERDR